MPGRPLPNFVGGGELRDQKIFDVFSVRRPNQVESWSDLCGVVDLSLIAELASLPDHNLKAVAVKTSESENLLLNFSLGAGVHEIVGKSELKTQDFSPADPTGEMLYMVEVQSVLLGQSRDLNNRLNGAKMMAEEQAYTDSLTGLNNRRAMRSFISRYLEREVGSGFAVLMLDLDHFKTVNDTLGHAAGDHVLQEVSRVLLSETRSTDMVARAGGDEFVVVLSDFGTILNLQEIAGRVISKLSMPISFSGQPCKIGASIGATMVPVQSDKALDQVLDEADAALYASKKGGRGMFTLFDTASGQDNMNTREHLEEDQHQEG